MSAQRAATPAHSKHQAPIKCPPRQMDKLHHGAAETSLPTSEGKFWVYLCRSPDKSHVNRVPNATKRPLSYQVDVKGSLEHSPNDP